ncbi:sensor domain-containing diguanylate cyclase [Luteimonas deserti]|uniref:diguanylate cyclase n=1 Tax=Luteimonas deserti TaxID=2752306 RepID=A0A7Z0QU40_9GAMM|nr:GGDEF domain-containing protein [Luteimonas deserti]NYZ64064.1 GGDEF domain-containing protein [Luteimonas deserti]
MSRPHWTRKSDSSWRRAFGRERLFVFALVLAFFGCGPLQAQPSLDRLIQDADAVRTSDARRFAELLGQIDALAEQATARQINRIRMLRVHQSITTGRSAEAIVELRRILVDAVDAETRFLAASMLANTHAVQRQFEDSLRALDAMLPLVEGVEDRELRHRGLMVAAIVYNQVGEYGLALRHVETVAQDQPVPRTVCAIGSITLEAKNGLGQSFDDRMAHDVLEKCADEPIFAAFVRWHLARQMEAQGRLSDAIALLTRHLPEVEATGYPFIIAQYHAALAELSMKAGEPAAARVHSDKALSISTEAMSAEAIVKAHHVQYLLALQGNDMESALSAYRLYAEAERAHFNDVKSREMAYQVVRHQSLQQAQQIELLHQKNEVLELQKRVTEQRAQNWLLLALVLVAGMTSVGYWAYKTKRLQVRLKRMTETDALTGICNRQHFSERAGSALAQCERAGEPAVLVMFDLDHFKQVNDRFGHAAGDWALRQVADAVRPLCRGIDAFGRLGGEEFALFLPGLDASAAARLANDAQVRIQAIDGAEDGYAFRITASFGVADVADGQYDLTSLMRQADQAMYAAKRGGRRQVRIYDSALESDDGPPPPVELLRGVARDPVPAATTPAGADARRAIA